MASAYSGLSAAASYYGGGIPDQRSFKAVQTGGPSGGCIPEDMLEQCQQYHEQLVETAAESSEEMMDKYLEAGELSIEEIFEGLRLQTLANEIVCVFCGSAFKNKGVQSMLDGIVDLMPSPVDVPPIKGVLPGKKLDARLSLSWSHACQRKSSLLHACGWPTDR